MKIELKQENASSLFKEMRETIEGSPAVEDVKVKSPRAIEFRVRGKKYKVEWYWNQSYLYFDEDSMFLFQEVEVSSTWPNRYKANLQFVQGGKTVAVIPLVPYGGA